MEISYHPSLGCRMYLNMYGCPIRTDDKRVVITIADQAEAVEAHVLKGNQRVLLPETVNEKVIQGLLHKDKVTIRIGSYCITPTLEGFEKTTPN